MSCGVGSSGVVVSFCVLGLSGPVVGQDVPGDRPASWADRACPMLALRQLLCVCCGKGAIAGLSRILWRLHAQPREELLESSASAGASVVEAYGPASSHVDRVPMGRRSEALGRPQDPR